MNFAMIILNQSISKMQNYATWIQVVLVFIFIKTEDFYEVIVDDVEKGFDTSNYEVNRPLSTGKNKKVLKDELGGGRLP